jgi:hypothetical protein
MAEAEKTPEPEAPPAKPKLELWKKFVIDIDVIRNLRTMIGLDYDEELPEALWIMLALHKAYARQFTDHSWGFESLANIIVQTHTLLPTMRHQTNLPYIPGSTVLVKTLNRSGRYWHPAPLGMHLVNCQGDVFVVKSEHLEMDESAVFDSELNKNARVGAQKVNAAEVLRPLSAGPPLVDLSKVKGELTAARA